LDPLGSAPQAGDEVEAGVTESTAGGIEYGAVVEGVDRETLTALKCIATEAGGTVVGVGGVGSAEGDVLRNTPALAEVERGRAVLAEEGVGDVDKAVGD
jgi:hypothetical protein